jgi:hypothetical protein
MIDQRAYATPESDCGMLRLHLGGERLDLQYQIARDLAEQDIAKELL